MTRGRARRALVATMVVAGAVAAPGAVGVAGAADGCTDRAGREGVTVRVVVDDGSTVAATAVCVPDGATGQDALAERARVLGRPAPRTDAAFLTFLCAIDGVPDRGCAVDNSADRYWAYWVASGGRTEWTYATVGMADRRLRAGDVDGWRLLPVGGRRLAPRACPTTPDCGPAPTAAPPTTAAPTPVVPATAPPARPSADGGPAVAAAPARPTARPTTTTSTVPPTSTTTTTAVVSTTGPAPAQVAGRRQVRGPSTTTTDAAVDDAAPTAGDAGGSADDGGAGTWAALGIVLVAGVLALIQSRRTRLRR